MGMSCKKRPIHQKEKEKEKENQQNQQQQKTTSFYCESNTAFGVSKKRLL